MADLRREGLPLRNQYQQGQDPLPLVVAYRLFSARVREMLAQGITSQEILEATEKATGITQFPGRNGNGAYQRQALHAELEALDLGRTPTLRSGKTRRAASA